MKTGVETDGAGELRYALEVLDEYKHLGLDDAYASKLRDILIRRIWEADETPSRSAVNPIRFPGTGFEDE